MPVVYILYDYEEHGAQNVSATLDRAKLSGMLRTALRAARDNLIALYGQDQAVRDRLEKAHPLDVAEYDEELQRVLRMTDSELLARNEGRHALAHGWGGYVLQVTELTE